MDVGGLSLAIGAGVALATTGILVAGWRHKLLIWALVGGGGAIVLVALGSLLPAAPSWLSKGFSEAATPSAWFSLGVFVVAMVIFYPLMKLSSRQPLDMPLGRYRDLKAHLSSFESSILERLKAVERIAKETSSTTLRTEIGELNTTLSSRIDLMDESIKTASERLGEDIIEIYRQIRVDAPNASTVHEAFKNLDDAVEIKISRLNEETQRFSDRVLWLDNDARSLLMFASDIATLEVLKKLAADGRSINIPTGPEDGAAERDTGCAAAQDYVNRVRVTFGDTYRGMFINNVLQHAEIDALGALRQMTAGERPSHIDLLDYREIMIAEAQRAQLVLFLESQCDKMREDIRAQRTRLNERLGARRPT
jgi:hypothetical protein